jgi:hypothetical protein
MLKQCRTCGQDTTYISGICHNCMHNQLNKIQPGNVYVAPEPEKVEFDEPSHYHEHGIDTIEFLKQGFPPEVYAHFCLGNIIKYAQRAEYKNGKDDYKKIVDYAKRLVEWVNEKNLGN